MSKKKKKAVQEDLDQNSAVRTGRSTMGLSKLFSSSGRGYWLRFLFPTECAYQFCAKKILILIDFTAVNFFSCIKVWWN